MTDKVQKIREEVEKLKLCTMDEHMKFYSDAAEAEYNALCEVEKIIDSLQEEPVRIDFEQELYKAFGQVKDFTLGMRIAKWFYDMGKNQAKVEIQAQSMALAHGCSKESVTKDLGDYINELSKQFPEVSFAKLSRIAVRVAKWQAEQMMAKAIDGKVIANGMGNPILHLWDKGKHLIDKKVKVILIKED